MIKDIALKEVGEWRDKKLGKWNKSEPPPSIKFSEGEVYQIARNIADKISELLINNVILKKG